MLEVQGMELSDPRPAWFPCRPGEWLQPADAYRPGEASGVAVAIEEPDYDEADEDDDDDYDEADDDEADEDDDLDDAS